MCSALFYIARLLCCLGSWGGVVHLQPINCGLWWVIKMASVLPAPMQSAFGFPPIKGRGGLRFLRALKEWEF